MQKMLADKINVKEVYNKAFQNKSIKNILYYIINIIIYYIIFDRVK